MDTFEKTKDFLVCIDSDGCVMDTMDMKHMRCLGPCLVHVWDLSEFRDEIIGLWRKVNLTSITRGVNRFSGLARVLEKIHENYKFIEGLEEYLDWECTTEELSEASLQEELQKNGNVCIKKALEWSELVNQSMVMVSDKHKVPFSGAKEAVELAQESANVAIVTAANGSEIQKEWEMAEMFQYVDLLMSQESGIKSDCLKQMLEAGYEPDHILMVGDAWLDYEAAREAGVLFYPILAYQEKESWEEFPQILKEFQNGIYQEKSQKVKFQQFCKNLNIPYKF